VEFADQQGRDEKPRQAEEHGHAQETVDERPSGSVLAKHKKDCDSADAIQSRVVTTVEPGHEPTLTGSSSHIGVN